MNNKVKPKSTTLRANDSQIVSDTLSVLAHDLKNPLSGIINIAKLLDEFRLSGPAGHYAKTLHRSSVSMMSILNDLLGLQHAENNNDYMLRPWELARELDDLYLLSAEEKGLDFKIYVDDAVPDVVLLKSLKIHRIANDLLTNALKYTKKGRVCLFIYYKIHESERAEFILGVADTGPGIDKNNREIFQKRNRGTDDESHETSGTGLGLAHVLELVKSMNGNVILESNKKTGSIFLVTLPVISSEKELLITDSSSQTSNQHSQQKKHINLEKKDPISQNNMTDNQKETVSVNTSNCSNHLSNNKNVNTQKIKSKGVILIVEDNEVVKEITSNYILSFGYTPVVWGTIIEAQEYIVENKDIKAVITDIFLPDGSGETLITWVKNFYCNQKYVPPVLVVTAICSEQDVLHYIKLGATTVLDKPIDVPILFASLSLSIRAATKYDDEVELEKYEQPYYRSTKMSCKVSGTDITA